MCIRYMRIHVHMCVCRITCMCIQHMSYHICIITVYIYIYIYIYILYRAIRSPPGRGAIAPRWGSGAPSASRPGTWGLLLRTSYRMNIDLDFLTTTKNMVDFRHFVFLLVRDPGTLKSDIVSKKHPQLICSDLRLSN